MNRILMQPARAIWGAMALLLSLIAALHAQPARAQSNAAAGVAPAPAPDRPADATAAIDRAQAEVLAVAGAAGQASGLIETGRLIDRADAAAHAAQRSVATLAAALADPGMAAPRRAAVVGQIARGGRVMTAAADLAARIRASPSQRIERTITTRTATPLGSEFWRAAATRAPFDLARFGRFMRAQADAGWRGVVSGAAWIAALAAAAAAALLFPARLWLRRIGRRFMIDRVPQSRLRRSGLALWRSLIGVTIPYLAILLLTEGFDAAGMVSLPWRPLAAGVTQAVLVGAAVAAVAGALLQRNQPSWRMLAVSDATAGAVRPWTIFAAIAVFVTVTLDALLAAADISAPMRDAVNVGQTLLHTAVTTALLLAVARARRQAAAAADLADARDGDPQNDDRGETRRGLIAVTLVCLTGALALIASLIALAMGYVALALLISRMLVWLPLVVAALYLAWLVVDDLASELVSGDSALGRSLGHALGVRASVVDQVGVALSAALRLLLLLIAAIAAFAPFGSNLGQLSTLADTFEHGVTIGQIVIAPGAILRGLIVFAIGLAIVRVAERWLAESYLPKTELDDGARNSISTVARYAGFLLAVAWALGALGIGFQRIALVLSALSVGIGFGLQAITQNFVSGLILLIERPVKIGDMVEVGGQKGDVKRISVRATEIEVSDRSTLIVPNSELITKTVRNMTHADPMGVVQLNFTVPLDTDVDAVKQLVLDLFHEAKSVFDTPEPKAFIDSIDDGVVHFNCKAFCNSPRAAYATRSEMFFRLLMALRDRGIVIGSSAAAGAAAASAPASTGSAGVIGNDDD